MVCGERMNILLEVKVDCVLGERIVEEKSTRKTGVIFLLVITHERDHKIITYRVIERLPSADSCFVIFSNKQKIIDRQQNHDNNNRLLYRNNCATCKKEIVKKRLI